MSAALDRVESLIGYAFKDRDLLQRALTHASFGDGSGPDQSYERLEFLGDRILGLMAAEYLDRQHPGAREGDLTRRFHPMVRKETCAAVAEALGLAEHVMSGELQTYAGKTRMNILGDIAEALIAAIYLDGRFEAAQAFFERHWLPNLDKVSLPQKDPIVRLQDLTLKKSRKLPVYEIVAQGGTSHKPVFECEVRVDNRAPVRGTGSSKQAARRAAAAAMLERIKSDD